MSPNNVHRSAAVALAALLALPAPAVASYTVTCNSNGYRYQYCRANTSGYARLVSQTSQSPCIRGRSWGSDYGGVWVNNGCSGRFEVGGNSGGGGNSDAGAAVAAVAGLAILGAIIANQDNDTYSGPPSQYPPPPPDPAYGGGVPGWAVGTFRGSLWGQAQTLQINPDGGVTAWYRNGGSARGWFSGDTLTIGNNAMNVQPSGAGILVNGSYFGR